MEKRFYITNPIIDDLIDYTGNEVELVGWSCREGNVIIKNWKFINYKGSTSGYSKRIHLNALNFVNCTFKDVNFAGAVPMDNCFFKKCTFENCILTDHIRWTSFDNCEFNFCLFSGYFHGSTFKKTCSYDNVLLEFYGDDSYFDGNKTNKNGYDNFYKNIIAKNTKSRNDILTYFYPSEMSEILKYPIAIKFYYSTNEWYFKPKNPNYKIIDGKEYYEDIVSDIYIDLKSYKPEIRVNGTHSVIIEECFTEKWVRKQKLDKINNFTSC